MKLWPFSKKASAVGPSIAQMYVGQAMMTPRRYDCLAKEAYQMNAVAYRCVKLIATSAASAPWLLKNGDKDVDKHPILDLLSRPAPMMSGAELFEAVYSYLLLAGNSYLEAVGPLNDNDGKRPPKELWALRPDRMQVVAGKYGLPEAYRYEVNGIRKDFPANPTNGASQILHIKEFNPLDDWYGMSRIEAAAFGIDRNNAAAEHNLALLQNGATPSGALVFKPVQVGTGEYKNTPGEVIKAAEDDLAARHGGSKNAGKPFVFGGNISWEAMGITPKDMDFGEGKADSARDICTSLGVPHILIVPGSATYNNIKEAKLEFYEETVLPLLDLMTDNLNMWLTPRYGDNLKLDIDKDEISALEPRREAKRTSVLDLYDKGLLDANEAREALQYGKRAAESIGKVDPTVLTALVNAVDIAGFEPLIRYMKSVGLYDQSMSNDAILAAATAHMDDASDEELDAALGEEDDENNNNGGADDAA